jgi:hypothetical protein
MTTPVLLERNQHLRRQFGNVAEAYFGSFVGRAFGN